MQLVNTIISGLTLIAVVWYVRETLKIRKAAEEQVEGLQKPCLMLSTEARELDEVVLQMDDTAGAMIVGQSRGRIAVENIGSGPAINISCRLKATDFRNQESAVTHESYLQNLSPRGVFETAVPRETLRFVDYDFSLSYESLSGRSYETVISIKDLVLTRSTFRRKAPASN